MGSDQSTAFGHPSLSPSVGAHGTGLPARAWGLVRRRYEYFLVPVVLLVLLGVWRLVNQHSGLPAYLVPSPDDVWLRFQTLASNGTLWKHTRVTLLEASLGFAISFVFALVLGYLLTKAPLAERLVSPYLVAAQTVPLVALAPLLVTWFGFGLASKVVIGFVMVFFPMLVNTIVGIRMVKGEQRELMRSYSASALQVLSYLELPSALSVLFGGFKIGITTAMAGAMVGEYIASNQGLGYMVLYAKRIFDFPQVFVAIFVLVTIDVALFMGVTGMESVMLGGRRREETP